MEVYFYCSYDRSPVGFQIGRVNANDMADHGMLSGDNILPFIRSCFEVGLLKSAYGCIPHANDENTEKKYFLLKKKMKGTKFERKFYISMAIVTDDWQQFQDLMAEEEEEAGVVSAVLDSIANLKDNAFGYEIDAQKIRELSKCHYAGICRCNSKRLNDIYATDSFYCILSTETPDIASLERNLGLECDNDKTFEIKQVDKSVFRVKKKIIQHTSMPIVRIGIAVMIVILVILLIVLL